MMPSRLTLYAVLAGFVLALLPAIVSEALWPLWVTFWGALVVGMGVDAVLTARRGEIQLSVEMPTLLHMGQAEQYAECRLALRSTRRRLRVSVKFDLGEQLEPVALQRAELSQREVIVCCPLRPMRRGRVTLEAAWLQFHGPFRLMQRYVKFDLSRTADAIPNVQIVRRIALEFFSARENWAGIKVEKFMGEGSEFDSIREFQQGHDRRSVDWKVSARHTKLMSREYRAERNHQIIIALDTGLQMSESLAGMPKLDHAIHAAMLMADFSVRTGDRVGLAAFDESLHRWMQPRGGAPAIKSVISLVGDLDYSLVETNYTLSISSIIGQVKRRSLVVIFTDFSDSVTAELMLENMHRLARRHVVIFVTLQDPNLRKMTQRIPVDNLTLNQAIVAQTLLTERELVLKRLQQFGVYCVDTEPNAVYVELINRYLRIKRRELI